MKSFKIPKYETETEKEFVDENSPINVLMEDVIPVNMGIIQSERMYRRSCTSIENDGKRGVSLTLQRPGTVTNGPLGESYRFKELHFHWNHEDDEGSEHSINNNFGCLEAHFVFRRRYTIFTEEEWLETAKKYDERIAERGPDKLHKPIKKASQNRLKSSSSIRMIVNKVEEIEEQMIHDRWQKEKSKKAVHSRRPTRFEFGTLPDNKEIDHSVDIGYKDEEEERKHEMNQEDYSKYKDMLKMQQAARKCAERQAHNNAKKEYIKWKAKEEELDAKIKKEREAEEEKDKANEIELGKMNNMDVSEKRKRKEKVADLYREQMKRDEANKNFDENLVKRRKSELQKIQKRGIELLCNIAVLFHIDEQAPFYRTFSTLSLVEEPFSEVIVDTNLLTEFKSVLVSPNYFAYHSIQPQSENPGILWIVMKDTLPIRKHQLDLFRQLKTIHGEQLLSCRRETKNLNRKVYMNWRPPVEKPFMCPGKDLCHCERVAEDNGWEKYKNL
ncbi:stress response protein nst1-like [Cimex lectularius]|uniref:carbonic anhydrase n=1 Tax=Cimex lectularius TaxID=79782 RepID=A0A8I6S5W3_CIMLE|nr:stress response protein nst1-like [Cimex lectularius]